MAEKQMSKAEKAAREMMLEMKAEKENERAYNQANQTPAAPLPRPIAPKPAMPMRPQAMAAPEDGTAVMKKGGSVSSASKRADGIAMRGKTKGKYL